MNHWLAYVGAILTGLLPPLIMYLIGAQKKVLGYAITKNEPLVHVWSPEMDQRLQLMLDGKPLAGCRLMEVTICNLGMKDIEGQSVHLTFPPGVEVYHVHCFSSTLAVGPTMETPRLDSHGITIPLMNPNDKVVIQLLMTGNASGKVLVMAKGPSLKFKQYDPSTFISPAINRGVLVMSSGTFAWILWACVGTERFLSKPFWEKTITVMLISIFLALPSAVLAYQGSIPLLKRWFAWRTSTEAK